MTKRDTHGHGSDQLDSLCGSVQEELPKYVTAEALGQRPPVIAPAVAAHLQHCVTCRTAFDELRQMTIDAYSGAVEPAARYTQPDLSFLPAQLVPATGWQPWRIDDWGRLIISFSQSLLESLRPAALLTAARGQLLYSYALTPPTFPGLDVHIEIFSVDHQADLSFVRVSVECQDRDPFDQAPSRVIARTADTSWEGTTDATGCIAFEAVPLAALPSLTIEIAAA